MSAHFELPRVRVVARHALPNIVEGSIIPVALFLLMLNLLGIWGAMLAGLGWSYTAVGRRLITRRPVPGVLILGAVTLTARSALAFGTGSSFVYFLQPTLGTALVATAFLLSVPLGRPLAQRLAIDFCPIPPEVMANRHVRNFFLRISLLWGLTGLLNASVALWLQLNQSVGTFVLVNKLSSATLTLSTVVVSVLWFKRSMTRHGILHARVRVATA